MTVVPLRSTNNPPTAERWLTFEEASEVLAREYGLRTTPRYLEKLADAGRRGAMPSKINFGKRQVQITAVLPWLREQGIIGR